MLPSTIEQLDTKTMNKHTKLAIIIAPFLAIGSYVATGYYADAKMKKQFSQERYLQLSIEGKCQIKSGNCKMKNGDFLLNLKQTPNGIHLATTHPITHAVISLVTDKNQEKLYKLKQNTDALNWQMDVDLKQLQDARTLRLMLMINKVSYLGEVQTTF